MVGKTKQTEIKLDWFDKIIEGTGILGVLLLMGLPIIYYEDLPDVIPKHYGLNGLPDGFGGKKTIWLLPATGLIIYIVITELIKYPHTFNYPKKITEDNAKQVYRITTKMLRFLKASIVCTFSYITYMTIQIALGKQDGLGNYFTLLFTAIIFLSTGYFITRIIKKKQITNYER